MNDYKENECSCSICQSMCKTPCIGTPEEMKKLKEAGYENRLSNSIWAYGKLVGTHENTVEIIAPMYDHNKNACTFFNEGKCELHELNLKPMEGRFASCNYKSVLTLSDLHDTPLYKCINEWEKLNSSKP